MSTSTVDNRDKNQYFPTASVQSYLRGYAEQLQKSLNTVDPIALEKALALIEATRKAKRVVWVAGNGGSHAIAEHLCCDWTKGLEHPTMPSLKVLSLGSNGALTSALANDFDYSRIFSEQVRMFGEAGDLLILISSSGNSPNVLQAASLAKEKGVKTIGLTGFSGGKLATGTDVNLHVPFENYGIVEDAHQAIMHIFAQYLYLKNK